MKELEEDIKQSLSVDEFWENNHKGKLKGYRFWLTGSSGPEVWKNLHVTKFIRPGTVVLNIGVGLGFCTRELVKRKCKVHALDISPAALAKVQNIVEGTWLPSTICNIPPFTFDLVISHLVSQHMTNRDLGYQISEILHSLKPSGVFAMQFACSKDPRFNSPNEIPQEAIKCGEVLRSLSGMAAIVEGAGGMIVWANRIGCFPKYGSGWYTIHIVRSDYPFVSSIPTGELSFIVKVHKCFAALLSGNPWSAI